MDCPDNQDKKDSKTQEEDQTAAKCGYDYRSPAKQPATEPLFLRGAITHLLETFSGAVFVVAAGTALSAGMPSLLRSTARTSNGAPCSVSKRRRNISRSVSSSGFKPIAIM